MSQAAEQLTEEANDHVITADEETMIKAFEQEKKLIDTRGVNDAKKWTKTSSTNLIRQKKKQDHFPL